MKNAVLIACLALTGCSAHVDGPAPSVGDRAPVFAASDFRCQQKVAPPDRQHRTAAQSLRYGERADLRGDDCSDKLDSAGRKASAAGLVQ